MTRRQAWMLHAANLLVGVTGVVYAVMRYAMSSDDPYAVVNHPWQPEAQHLHVLFAPTLVFMVGVVWLKHVYSYWSRGMRDNRKSGLSLMYAVFPMILSGYLLQIAVEEPWRKVWIGVHLAASVLWIGGYLAHQFQAVLRIKPARMRKQ